MLTANDDPVVLIQHGYTPAYVEHCQAETKRKGITLEELIGPEAEIVQGLAKRWGITQIRSRELQKEAQ